MNFDQLRYVKEILETKSISIAAQNLFITQPAISQSISLLEKELGLKLFQRSRSGSIPTDEGKIIIQKMIEILNKENELKESLKIIASNFTGDIKIATSPSICMTFLLKTIAQFNKDYPQIKLSIKEMEKEDIISSVKEYKSDVGLTFLFGDKELLPSLEFFQLDYPSEYKVLVAAYSPLAKKKTITMKDIQKHPYILYKRNYMINLIKEIEQNYGEVNVILETNNTEIVKRAIVENLGVTITSSLLIENDPYIKSQQIVAIPLEKFPLNEEAQIGGIYKEDNNKAEIIKAFLECLHI